MPSCDFVIGLASGLGNAVFMLPLIAALKIMGNTVAVFVQTDFDTVNLWRRLKYADYVIEPPMRLNGHRNYVCGQWRPAAWAGICPVSRRLSHPYREPEWKSNFGLAYRFGWKGGPPDVSDWCKGLEREQRFDVGIIPGSKDGIWLRKRFPGMAALAEHFISRGRSVVVFGRASDGIAEIPGTYLPTPDLSLAPDLLASCRLIIGTDSGLSHLAASLGVPTLMIYTATSEIKGDPVGRETKKIIAHVDCRPCQSTPRWYQCSDWICRNIDPSWIAEQAEGMLA